MLVVFSDGLDENVEDMQRESEQLRRSGKEASYLYSVTVLI